MPLDRRRTGVLRYLHTFLPWDAQDKIGEVLYDRPIVWLFLSAGLVTILVGPWPVALLALAWSARRAWRLVIKQLEARARVRDGQPAERALWVVPLRSIWALRVMMKTGCFWLPASAPLLGGDILLFDVQELGQELPLKILLAGRLANPLNRTSRRRRRLVRLGALWSLGTSLTLDDLPELKAAWTSPRPEICSLDYADERRAVWRDRLAAKTSFREPRKPTWRKERKAFHLFHKLWGMAHDHDNYEKPVWGDLQGALRGAGVWV